MNIVINHIKNNVWKYGAVLIIFFIGVIIGAIYLQNSEIRDETIASLDNVFGAIKSAESFKITDIFVQVIMENMIVILIVWILGSSIVGVPLLCLYIGYIGFSFGLTISAVVLVLGNLNGLLMSLGALFLPSIFKLPAIFLLAISGLKFAESILKGSKDIKTEVIRHTIILAISAGLVTISAVIESGIIPAIIRQIIDKV